MRSIRLRRLGLISMPIVAALALNCIRSALETSQHNIQPYKEVTAYSEQMKFIKFHPMGGFVEIKFCEDWENCNSTSTKLAGVPIIIYRIDNTSYTLITNQEGSVTITDPTMIGFAYPKYLELEGERYVCNFVPEINESQYEITITTSSFACPSIRIES